jgi:hypothetical protein
MLGYVIIPMTCGYPWLPPLVGRLWEGFPLFDSPCRTLRFVGECCRRPPISLVSDPMNEGPSRVLKDYCGTLCSPNRLTEKESIAMAKLRYCERVHTHFPVVFASEAYVGEGTVLNVSVPGCAVHSRMRVQTGSYLEMRMLVLDATSPLRVGLAKVRWCEGRRFGVEFIQMPGEDQVRLGRLVKEEIPLALAPRSSAWQEAHS